MTEEKKPRRKRQKAPPAPSEKQPFDMDEAISLLRKVTAPYPKAALFELYQEGYTSVFEILIACILSIRTRDEVTLPTARHLFGRARTPVEVLALSVEGLAGLIAPCLYAGNKAQQIHDIARTAVERHGGALPCDREVLLGLRGVGPKCGNLTLGIVCGVPLIGVDTHVHRVTNRWGYVSAATAERTMVELEKKLPKRYWVTINELLVPFGKHICSILPRCSACPLLDMCQQVGVTKHV